MKISDNYILRQIADEYILVPLAEASAKLNGIISLNGPAADIVEALKAECTEKELIDMIVQEYGVEYEIAQKDVLDFLKELKEINAII